MATRTKEPGAPTSFFASLPGVLTAVAAVITAVGGVYGVWWTSRPEPAPGLTPVVHEQPSSTTDGDLSTEQLEVLVATLLAADGEPEADADGQADVDADATSFGEDALLEWYDLAPDSSRLSLELCASGDTASCDEVWYLLVDDCSVYLGPACDALYWLSPVDSAEEELGGTCGGLEPDLAAAGACP